MKLVGVFINFAGNYAKFIFTSPSRVDFRVLVKELVQEVKMRVEMRQVGVRDGTRYIDGIGTCGCRLCCSRWLTSFHPISLRLAKEQNLALNNDKLSGVCGRLRCCLAYENEVYKEKRVGLPKIGKPFPIL